MKRNNKPRLIFLILSTLLLGMAKKALALNMRSDHYKIQWGNFNISSGKPTSNNYSLGITMGEIAPGLYSNVNYKARVGFQYIHSIDPFSFTISDINIDLGSLIVQTPSTDTNTLTVNCDSSGGYQVLAFETHPLKANTNYVADTTCDGDDCDQATAGVWSQNTTYGFGFNINGDDAPVDFTNSTYFRQFADDSAEESAQIVMSNVGSVDDSQAVVTYKANVSSSQTTGKYETSIVYLAIPSY